MASNLLVMAGSICSEIDDNEETVCVIPVHFGREIVTASSVLACLATYKNTK